MLLAEQGLLPGCAGTTGRQMGLAQRLGDPIAGRALQGPGDGGSEINAVPHGYVYRLHSGPRSHGGTHRVSLVDQGRASAALRCKGAVLADEDGLGAANGREVKQHAEVAGQAEPARVGQALAVYQEKIGRTGEPGHRGEDGWRLPEREQAGDIGELGWDNAWAVSTGVSSG